MNADWSFLASGVDRLIRDGFPPKSPPFPATGGITAPGLSQMATQVSLCEVDHTVYTAS